MHAVIDAFTDSNQWVSRSKSRLGSRGYLKGVVVDVVYDHLLSKNWACYLSIELEGYVERFNQAAMRSLQALSGEGADFISRIVEYEILSSYREFRGVEQALFRLDRRLSDRILARESASSYIPLLEQNLESIEQDFLQFFPQLAQEFVLALGSDDHYLINSEIK